MVDHKCSLTSANKVLTYVLIFFLVLLICYVIFYIVKMISTKQNETSAKKELFSEQPVIRKKIIGFFMPGCGYCVKFSPVFDKVVTEYSQNEVFNKEWSVLKESDTTLAKTKYNITSFPSVVIEDDGKVVEIKVGSMNEVQFKEFLEKYISVTVIEV